MSGDTWDDPHGILKPRVVPLPKPGIVPLAKPAAPDTHPVVVAPSPDASQGAYYQGRWAGIELYRCPRCGRAFKTTEATSGDEAVRAHIALRHGGKA